jgi:hypothetical protein
MPETLDMRPSTACPRCGSPLAGEQDWCLECGLAARARLAPAPGWRVPLLAAAGLGLAALVALVVAFVVVSGDNGPVTTTTPAARQGPPAAQVQLAKLRTCLGPQAHPLPVFAATVQLAEAQRGGVAVAAFGRQKVELIVFATPAAAQTGYQNAQDQLIQLQQTQPATFTALSAREQVIGNVLEIIVRGALSPTASAKVGGCINPAA